MTEIDLLEQKMNDLVEEIKRLKEKQAEKRELLRWRGNYGDKYWFLNLKGYAEYKSEQYIEIDDFLYNTGNYFRTREEVVEYKNNLITKQQLKDLALELNNGREMNWCNPDQLKYGIVYDAPCCKLDVLNTWSSYSTGEVYCLKSDFLEIAKERIGVDDLVKLIKSGV